MFKLHNKTALITGSTGGIGSAIAKTLYKQGAKIIISGTKLEKLQELAKEIAKEDAHKISCIPCNLADLNEVENLFDKAEEFSPIDILVCNAGITKDNLILRMKTEDFQQVIDTNLRSTFILNRNAIKKMLKRKYGRIINIASVVASTGNPGQANYVASKAGMIGLSKSLASEVATREITVNCISPGFITSPMTDILTDVQKHAILAKIPAGKMGTAQEIANAVAFLASQEASYITGHNLQVNGGMFMN
ncbi:MAG: 3-oxoacyl-ACP reductase FabG [Proteobacteria bacterium]|jgi:3-oxoacyl-[acyl-carrier protein] reductase|nr:3-oxoacyl-ACP reductase FabG [Pseudomonadota bacterium]